MNLREFNSLLKDHADRQFKLLLPTGAPVPVSFHVTEVGRVQKTFLDCGGALHDTTTCQIQCWVGEDEDHRLIAGKVASILAKARQFLTDDSVPVEIEYEDSVISQYPISGFEITDDAVILELAPKHTDCLAKELCGIPAAGTFKVGAASASKSSCCGPNCC